MPRPSGQPYFSLLNLVGILRRINWFCILGLVSSAGWIHTTVDIILGRYSPKKSVFCQGLKAYSVYVLVGDELKKNVSQSHPQISPSRNSKLNFQDNLCSHLKNKPEYLAVDMISPGAVLTSKWGGEAEQWYFLVVKWAELFRRSYRDDEIWAQNILWSSWDGPSLAL